MDIDLKALSDSEFRTLCNDVARERYWRNKLSLLQYVNDRQHRNQEKYGPNQELLEWRTRHGYTQRDAGKRFGVAAQTVCGWEKGRERTPDRVMEYIRREDRE